MRLYNSLSKKIEIFESISKDQVKLYSCGPTVYDYATIGNLRAFIFVDTLRRVLQSQDLSVRHVMNITDVGHLVSDSDDGLDKLEKGALRENKSVWEVADHYIEAFKADMEALSILPPNGYHNDQYARATDFISEQVDLVKILIDKNYAYQTEQAIYFDVTRLSDYGKLSGQKLLDKAVGARKDVVTDSKKRNPHDFALWFFKVGRFSEHVMSWPTPWGDGFPGWHLECSAIIHSTLEDPIDIHTGGVDHIGTHHTNELAQTSAAYGNQLANYWLHNEFMLVDGGKMGKSLGNAYKLSDLVKRGYSPADFRLFCLQTHYRSELNFSWDSLSAARNRLLDFKALSALRFQPNPEAQSLEPGIFNKLLSDINNLLSDDLETQLALNIINKLIDLLNINNGLAAANVDDFTIFISKLDELFGLQLLTITDISNDIKNVLEQRLTARLNKDWKVSDQLREELTFKNISVKDLNEKSALPYVWSPYN